MKNNYKEQKSIYFGLILLLGAAYIFFMGSLAVNLYHACVSKLMFLTGFDWSLSMDAVNIALYSYILTFLIFILLVSKGIFSGFKAVLKFKKTEEFVNSFETTQYDEFVLIHSDEALAFTRGFLSPKIYLSEGLISSVDKKELNAIKLHEIGHARSFDPLKIFISDFVENLLIWFPLKNRIFSKYKLLTELCADENAVLALESRKPVVSALYKLIGGVEMVSPGFSSHSERIGILVGQSSFQSTRIITYIFMALMTFSASAIALNKVQPFNLCSGVESCFVDEYLRSNDYISGMTCVEQKVIRNYSPSRQSISN